MNKSIRSVEEIMEIVAKHKPHLAQKYKIKEIGLLGSFVRGEQKRGSDIDILVEFEELPDLFEFIELETSLSRLLRKKVDLVEKSSIRPKLKDVILSDLIVI